MSEMSVEEAAKVLETMLVHGHMAESVHLDARAWPETREAVRVTLDRARKAEAYDRLRSYAEGVADSLRAEGFRRDADDLLSEIAACDASIDTPTPEAKR